MGKAFFKLFDSFQDFIYDMISIMAFSDENSPIEKEIIESLLQSELGEEYIRPILEFANIIITLIIILIHILILVNCYLIYLVCVG